MRRVLIASVITLLFSTGLLYVPPTNCEVETFPAVSGGKIVPVRITLCSAPGTGRLTIIYGNILGESFQKHLLLAKEWAEKICGRRFDYILDFSGIKFRIDGVSASCQLFAFFCAGKTGNNFFLCSIDSEGRTEEVLFEEEKIKTLTGKKIYTAEDVGTVWEIARIVRG